MKRCVYDQEEKNDKGEECWSVKHTAQNNDHADNIQCLFNSQCNHVLLLSNSTNHRRLNGSRRNILLDERLMKTLWMIRHDLSYHGIIILNKGYQFLVHGLIVQAIGIKIERECLKNKRTEICHDTKRMGIFL